ncbi:phage portal protein, partial [Cronobacter sakazakii]
TDERTLQISTVWACIRLISTVTASLPLDIYKTKDGQRSKADPKHPLAQLLRFRPNNFMTALEFREAMTMQLCAYGNA